MLHVCNYNALSRAGDKIRGVLLLLELRLDPTFFVIGSHVETGGYVYVLTVVMITCTCHRWL